MSEALEALRLAVQDNGWISRRRTNVDEAAYRVYEAAQALLDSEPAPGLNEPEPEPWEDHLVAVASFTVMGLPAPQGSKTRMPNGALVEGRTTAGRARHQSWRSAVVEAAAKEAGGRPPLDGPLILHVILRVPMPRSRPKRVLAAGMAPSTVKPDLDKLIRGVLDGMVQGGLIVDDARVCQIEAEKVEVIGWTGAQVVLSRPS